MLLAPFSSRIVYAPTSFLPGATALFQSLYLGLVFAASSSTAWAYRYASAKRMTRIRLMDCCCFPASTVHSLTPACGRDRGVWCTRMLHTGRTAVPSSLAPRLWAAPNGLDTARPAVQVGGAVLASFLAFMRALGRGRASHVSRGDPAPYWHVPMQGLWGIGGASRVLTTGGRHATATTDTAVTGTAGPAASDKAWKVRAWRAEA